MVTLPTVFDKFHPELKTDILKAGTLLEVPAGQEILREGQFLSVVPFVISGLLKVYKKHEDKDLLLYYIQENESCIMTFSSSIKSEPSKIEAIAEKDSVLLLLPSDKINGWLKKYPEFNMVFFDLYNLRYSDFIDTLNHFVFDKMDKRLLDFLREKSELIGKNPIKITHRQIASELGTAREVVSRIMKKLETEKVLEQISDGIKLL